MYISILVARSKNKAIGKDNALLWKLSDDLKLFKTRTLGKSIIMGRKTFDSIGKALPGRRNIVISKNKNLKIENVEIFDSLKSAIEACFSEEEVCIIGGGTIYDLAWPLCSKVYLTEVDVEIDGDTFFYHEPDNTWTLTEKLEFSKSEKNEYDFIVSTFIK